MTATDLDAVAEQLARQAETTETVEVCVSRRGRTSVKAYGGEVESFTSAESFGVGVRVLRDHRQGFAHAGSLDADVLAETLAEARDNVAFGEPDEWFGLAEPDGVEPVSVDLWNPAVLDYANDDKIATALELERAVKASDPRITGVRTATFADGWVESALATSTGISVSSRGTVCHISCSAMAEADGETTIAGGVDAGRDPQALDADKVVDDAVSRALRILGARPTASRRLAIVLEPELAATVLGIVVGTLNGERVLKGRSPFADRVGEQIASPLLTLVDDPTEPASLGADTYDGEGLACRRNVLIEDGVLRGFLHDSYTGRRSGAGSTGSAVRGARSLPGPGAMAPAVTPGPDDLDALVASIDEGLLVQSMSGLHSGVNAVSGDFSVGAEGLLIRDGALAEPVREVTVASTLQRLLADVVAVGSDFEWLPGGSGAASLVIEGVALSGT